LKSTHFNLWICPIIFSYFLLLEGGIALSQSVTLNNYRYGVNLGLGSSRLQGKYAGKSFRPGYIMGGVFEYFPSNRNIIGVEVNFSRRGGRTKNPNNWIETQNLEIPIYYKAILSKKNVGTKFFVQISLDYLYIVFAKGGGRWRTIEKGDNELGNSSFNVRPGIGINFLKNFDFSINYGIGINRVYRDSFRSTTGVTRFEELYNHYFDLRCIYTPYFGKI